MVLCSELHCTHHFFFPFLADEDLTFCLTEERACELQIATTILFPDAMQNG